MRQNPLVLSDPYITQKKQINTPITKNRNFKTIITDINRKLKKQITFFCWHQYVSLQIQNCLAVSTVCTWEGGHFSVVDNISSMLKVPGSTCDIYSKRFSGGREWKKELQTATASKSRQYHVSLFNDLLPQKVTSYSPNHIYQLQELYLTPR